jgi:hypothetical protein
MRNKRLLAFSSLKAFHAEYMKPNDFLRFFFLNSCSLLTCIFFLYCFSITRHPRVYSACVITGGYSTSRIFNYSRPCAQQTTPTFFLLDELQLSLTSSHFRSFPCPLLCWWHRLTAIRQHSNSGSAAKLTKVWAEYVYFNVETSWYISSLCVYGLFGKVESIYHHTHIPSSFERVCTT